MAEYYKTLFTQNKNQQILIHDIRKHLTSLAQLNAKNEQIKIQEYLETLLNSSELQDSVRVSDNDMVNSILCHYTKSTLSTLAATLLHLMTVVFLFLQKKTLGIMD